MPIMPPITLPSMRNILSPAGAALHRALYSDVTQTSVCNTGYTAKMHILKRIGGVLLIIIGFIALVTPFTPGAWLMFVGLELIGVRLVIWDKIKARLNTWRGVQSKNTPPGETGEHLTK